MDNTQRTTEQNTTTTQPSNFASAVKRVTDQNMSAYSAARVLSNARVQDEEAKQWFQAIVDNETLSSGSKVTEYGFMIAHCDDAETGEFVLVNKDGKVRLVEQAKVISEDYRKHIDEFKKMYYTTRDEYTTYLQAQELAKEGSEWATPDAQDPHKVATLTDALTNSFHALFGTFGAVLERYSISPSFGGIPSVPHGPEKEDVDIYQYAEPFAQTWQDYWKSTAVNKTALDAEIDLRYGKDWKATYSGSVDNFKKLLELDVRDDVKQYMAYQIATETDGPTFVDWLVGALNEVADAGDFFSNMVKAFTINGINKNSEYKDYTPEELLINAYAPTWSEGGRHSYIYDTGNLLTDLVLELISDPTVWISLGTGGLVKGAGKTVMSAADEVVPVVVKAAAKTANTVGDDVAEEIAESVFKKAIRESSDKVKGLFKKTALEMKTNLTISEGIRAGLDNDEIASKIATHIQGDGNVSKVLVDKIKDALDYSVSYKLATSLQPVDDILNTAQLYMSAAVAMPSKFVVRSTIRGVKAIKNFKTLRSLKHLEDLTTKAMADAHLEITGDIKVPVGVHCVEGYLNALEKNILGIDIAHNERILNQLTQEVRVRVVADSVDLACQDLDKTLSMLSKKAYTPETIAEYMANKVTVLTKGKCDSLDSFIDEVMRILKDNDVYDEAIVARLNSTKKLYDNLISKQIEDVVVKAFKQYKNALKQYYNTTHTLRMASPKYMKYVKYVDFMYDLGVDIISFKEFWRSSIFRDRLLKTRYLYDEFIPESLLSKSEFARTYFYTDALNNSQLQDTYSAYARGVAERNYIAKQTLAEEIAAWNQRVADNNKAIYDEAFEMYKAYRAEVQDGIYAQFKATNKSIEEANLASYAAAYESYLDAFDLTMRNITSVVTNNTYLFPTTQSGEELLKRINTILEQEKLNPGDWKEIYELLERAVQMRKDDEYVRLKVGTAELPYTEDLTAHNLESLRPIEAYLKDLEATGRMQTSEDFGDLSTLDGKLYAAKLNHMVEADEFLSNPLVNHTYADVLNQYDFGRAVYELVQTGDVNTNVHKAASALIDDAYSAQRYQNLVHSIQEAKNISPALKTALLDKMFSIDSITRAMFQSHKTPGIPGALSYDSLTNEFIERTTRNTVRKWISDAWTHISKVNEDWCNTYRILKCNEPDTLANVRNIEKQFDIHCPNRDSKYTYVFYSTRFAGESGGLLEFSMRTADGYEFTAKLDEPGSRLDQQEFLAYINSAIEKLQSGGSDIRGAGSKGTHLKFVGFNNHATGYDLDRRFNKLIYSLGESNIHLNGTIDVAEQMRIAKGLPVVPEAAYADLEDILLREVQQWFMDVRHLGCDLNLSIVPSGFFNTTFNMYAKLTNNLDDPISYALARRFKELSNAIQHTQKSITMFNKSLSQSGLLFTEHYTNIMPLMNGIADNELASVIATKLRFDDKVVSRYFDKAVLADGNGLALFEAAQAYDKVLSKISDYDILHMYAREIDEAFKHIVAPNTATGVWLSSRGIILKDAKVLTTAEKYAVLYHTCTSMGFKSLNTVSMLTGSKGVADLIFNAKHIVFGVGKEANVTNALRGAAVRSTSLLNESSTILNKVESVSQTLKKYTSIIEAQELAERSIGITGSLESYCIRAKANAASGLRDYIRFIDNLITRNNEANYAKFKELYHKSPTTYRQVMQNTKTVYDLVNDAMYEFSKQHDVVRLAYISNQTTDDLVNHLIKDCNGRMLLDLDTCDASVVNRILDKLRDVPNIKHDEFNGYVRIWFSRKTVSDIELDGMVQRLRTFSLAPLKDALYMQHLHPLRKVPKTHPLIPETNELLKELTYKNMEMLERMAEHGPNNLTYGMFTVNDPTITSRIDEIFFSDIADDLLDYSTLNALGNFKGQALCTYHGNIHNLVQEELFLSNNQFTNICNMYGHIINTLDSTYDILKVVFSSENSLANTVKLFETMDNVVGHKAFADALNSQGYVAVVLSADKSGRLLLDELDITNKKIFDAALNNKYTTIMRYDAYRELQERLINKNLAMSSAKQTSELHRIVEDTINIYNKYVRYPFIQSMMFMKAATWMRNIPDSVAKALLKEGAVYLEYIPMAMKVDALYKSIEDNIYKSYRKITPDTISKFFKANPDCGMTKDMFTSLKAYKQNPISGTAIDNILDMFNVNPTAVFKIHGDLDIDGDIYEKAIEVFNRYLDKDIPDYRKMSAIRKDLLGILDGDDADIVASKLTGFYTQYATFAKFGANKSFLDRVPILNRWIGFNTKMFKQVEQVNRLAIFLKRMDSGDNMGQALKAIGETQFDYSKSALMKSIELVAPFSTFRLYNYKFWLDTVWGYSGAVSRMGDFANILLPESDNDYWTDENMSYRALVSAYLDGADKSELYQSYDSIEDYKGVKEKDAMTYGWVRISDKLYLKLNSSWIDAMNLSYVLGNPAEAPAFAWDMVFAPIKSATELLGGLYDMTSNADKVDTIINTAKKLNLSDAATSEMLSEIVGITQYTGQLNPNDAKYALIRAYIKEHEYDLHNLFPIIGSLYYSVYSMRRNLSAAEKNDPSAVEWALSVIPSLFAPVKDNAYNTWDKSYYARPVGFDWYNQSDEYRATHRYVVGVSYVPSWCDKSPANYIDTWGRMEQMGIPKEALPELFEKGKGWWFVKDNYGNYKLQNHQLIMKDEATSNEVYATLLKYGWSEEDAKRLMDEVSVPAWNNTPKPRYTYNGYGKYRNLDATGILSTAHYSSRAAINKAKYVANKAMRTRGVSASVSAATPRTYRQAKLQARGHDVSRLSKDYQKDYRWHRRTRDIYRDNYAKYGASRMAMEQNLRAYSNRSITEMRRTNQNIRYARIHNRWWAT